MAYPNFKPMTNLEAAILKLQQLPESEVRQINDLLDTLLQKYNYKQEHQSSQCPEWLELANAGLSDYLSNLEDYEERLARGEIQW